jgi:hypothetical protein
MSKNASCDLFQNPLTLMSISTSTIIYISRMSSNGLTIERLECRFCGHTAADFSEK